MKTKHKLILLLATILWICYAAVVVLSYLDYSVYVSTTIAKYEQRGIPREYIDLFPYMQYGYSGTIIASGIIYFLINVALGLYFYKPKPPKAKISNVKTASLVFLLIISIVVPVIILQTPVKAATTTTLTAEYVQCCMYFDEECTDANHREWLYNEFFAHGAGISTYDKFKDYYNLIFLCENGHDSFWDSNDGVTDTYDLLQEAIRQAGGVWDATNHWWVWTPKDMLCPDGVYRWIDCLIIICGQPMDMLGLSPPMWNAMITNFDPQTYVCMHELSHQFWCEHCGNFCCMNAGLGILTPECWCGTCSSWITSHREKWGAKELISIDIMAGGHGYTNPCVGTHERVIGSSVTIQAFPDSGYMFTKWTFVSTYGVDDITDNPYTFTMPAYSYVIHTTILRQRTLTITKVGRGSTNPAVGSYIYPNNAYASVTATPDTGFAFKYWYLDSTKSTSNPINVLMDNNHALKAYFTDNYRLTITISNGKGTVTPSVGDHWYYDGTSVTITATGTDGYHFAWMEIDGKTSYNSAEIVTMDKNHLVEIYFNPSLVLFAVYNEKGTWLADCCQVYYRKSGTTDWICDYGRIDWDPRDPDAVGSVLLLPGAELDHYNYYTVIVGGTYDFMIYCNGYDPYYAFNVNIPIVQGADLVGFPKVVLKEYTPVVTGGCSGGFYRICLCCY